MRQLACIICSRLLFRRKGKEKKTEEKKKTQMHREIGKILRLFFLLSGFTWYPPLLRCILSLQQLGNRSQLDITRALINLPNLTVPPVLFRQSLPHKAHATHPFNRLS